MGLTKNSTGISAAQEQINPVRRSPEDKIIALSGNPNVGKSTVFNYLTGMNQHTGNWPGKTVSNAFGRYTYEGSEFILVDIPGTYSLMANSQEEEIARNFICFGNPDTTIVVADATCLERNLNLVLQILEASTNVVVCLNLMDEARKKGIEIDADELSLYLGVPVVTASARSGEGLDELIKTVYEVAYAKRKTFRVKLEYDELIESAAEMIIPAVEKLNLEKINARWLSLKLLDGDVSLCSEVSGYVGCDIDADEDVAAALKRAREFLLEHRVQSDMIRDRIVTAIVKRSEFIYNKCVSLKNERYAERDRRIDRLLTSRMTGIPIMLLVFGLIFWITISGANYPSELLSKGLFYIQDRLCDLFVYLNAPDWLHNMLVHGVYRTLAWVVSVMLPPMAIFFPLFTLLEDSGYLPRIAFNMDKFFKRAGAHGKQSLTMCMGFGCNACGVIGCRIIDSPRERLIAVLTNNFVPCNGRFPTIIALITMFFSASVILPLRSAVSSLILLAVIVIGVAATLGISKLLSKTLLSGQPSSFSLELPPYRRPQVGKVIVRSIFDRTLFVLGRAAAVAAPAGLVIWIMANISVGGSNILGICADFLDPFARLMGLDGIILMAFILGFPANEIVVPIIIMGYLCSGSLTEFESLTELYQLLCANGWTLNTAVCAILFSLFHFPCATTCLTIKKETKSLKWTALSVVLPTVTGIILCMLVTAVFGIING